ncbi:hypothetical protein G6F58_013385 [Rhizopus delemar]|nr:hypothetical protein G6F58_013385 [Rhizopus delemar]
MLDRRDLAQALAQHRQPRQAVATQRRIFRIDHHAIEEGVDLRAQPGQAGQHGHVVLVLQAGAGVVDGRGDGFSQRALGVFLQQRRVDLGRNVALGLAQDVADALVGRGQSIGFRQRSKGYDRNQPADDVDRKITRLN